MPSISGSPKAPNVENAISANPATYKCTISSNSTRNTSLDTGNRSDGLSNPYIIYNDSQIAPSSNHNNPEYFHPISSTTSSNNIQNVYLDTGNSQDEANVPYVIYSDPQITSKSNQNNSKKHHSLNTPIFENNKSDTQTDESFALPVDYGAQRFYPAPRTTPLVATPSPSIIIHAHTVVIGSSTPSHILTHNTAAPHKCSTKNSADEHRAPAPLTTPSIPPRDLSGLRLCH